MSQIRFSLSDFGRTNIFVFFFCSSEMHPAFFHSYDYIRGHKLGVIRLHPNVSEQMSRELPPQHLHARHLPMLVRPKPWVSHDQGGYLINKSGSISLGGKERDVDL